MTDPLEEIVTLEEAADLLGITKNAALKAARRGAIRARRFGAPTRGLWITTHDDVDRYRALVRQPRPRKQLSDGAYLDRVLAVRFTSDDGLDVTLGVRPPGEHEDGDLELEIRADGTAVVR